MKSLRLFLLAVFLTITFIFAGCTDSGNDNHPPEISFDEPDDGDEMDGMEKIEVDIADVDDDVVKVDFFYNAGAGRIDIGSVEMEVPTSGEVSISWDTLAVPDGDYDIIVVATDSKDNVVEASVEVTVNNVVKPGDDDDDEVVIVVLRLNIDDGKTDLGQDGADFSVGDTFIKVEQTGGDPIDWSELLIKCEDTEADEVHPLRILNISAEPYDENTNTISRTGEVIELGVVRNGDFQSGDRVEITIEKRGEQVYKSQAIRVN